MNIGIIGTRGIPNHYGGFEQFAEHFALYLAARGHTVTVYNSSLHPYKEQTYQGVNIIRKYDPENRIGTAGQFVYDALCIADSRRRGFDIILQLGYTSSSVFSWLFPGKACLVTNMDGMEWKRSKYSGIVRRFLKKAEAWAVKYSDVLIADSKGIQKYLADTYEYPSVFIPYGAAVFEHPDALALQQYKVEAGRYAMLVARMEPENNVATILEAYMQSGCHEPLLVVGNYNTGWGKIWYNTYHSDTIRFVGAIYDQQVLSSLRYYANLYFHGHSVGGTNPSLIEAMACRCLIIAHDNIFNRAVLEQDAFYFSSVDTLVYLLRQSISKVNYPQLPESNIEKVKTVYNPDAIHRQLEAVFKQCTEHAG